MQLLRLVPCLVTVALAAADPAPAPVPQPAAAPTAVVPVDAAGFVAGWIAAVRGNNLTPMAGQLASLAEPADGRRGPGGIGGITRMLGDGQHAGLVLSAAMAELAGALVADGKAPAAVALPEEPRFLAFMPRMLGRSLPGAVAGGILARDLETRQGAALDAWATAYATWAAQGALADAAAAGKAQAALAAAQAAAKPDAAPAAQLAVLLPALKQALFAYGLDVDAALASAVVEAEGAAAADGGQTVVVRFKAFAVDHALPLRVRRDGAGWALVADSPLARWLRAGGGGMMGGRGMPGQRGNQRGGQNGRGGEAPAPAPAPAGPPASGSF